MEPSPFPITGSEPERLAELEAYNVLDTTPERVFDDVVRLAQSLFGVATSTVSLIDGDRQWFKARIGLDVCETGRDAAFCGHAILDSDVMVVPDAPRHTYPFANECRPSPIPNILTNLTPTDAQSLYGTAWLQ